MGNTILLKKKKESQSLNESSKIVLPLFLHLPWHYDQYHSIKGFPNSYDGKNCTQQAIKSLILNTHT